jgi:undecaprenyl diphosphate synthase
MDGNGRWATARGLPRVAGHQEGARAVRESVKAALSAALPIQTLTLYAFSSDNWRRPVGEVCALMGLFERFLRAQAAPAARERIRVSIIGRRDRLSLSLLAAIERVEALTRSGDRLHVRLAVDYSAREAIWQAARRALERDATRERFEAMVASGRGEPADVPPVDLLVRTGGEQRLSDFLLWECAYAELCFLPVMWPDFTAADLASALASFSQRDRRFGGLRIASTS